MSLGLPSTGFYCFLGTRVLCSFYSDGEEVGGERGQDGTVGDLISLGPQLVFGFISSNEVPASAACAPLANNSGDFRRVITWGTWARTPNFSQPG